MPVEIVGMLGHRESTLTWKSPKTFDAEYVLLLARALEHAGYDRALVAQSAFWPDSMPFASFVAGATSRLKFMIAHRPGFVAPTMAARQFATLDKFSNGRAGIHIISAGNDAETQCDGDFLTKDERYRRSGEFVQILRAIWGSETPIDHDGTYFRFIKGLSELRPAAGAIPIYWGGTSEVSLDIASQWADIYVFSLTSLEATRKMVEDMTRHARAHGRALRFQGVTRMVLGPTEEMAWRNAREIADILRGQTEERRRKTGTTEDLSKAGGRSDAALSTKGAAPRPYEVPAEIVDARLWYGTMAASEGSTPPTLVGTAEQVVEALMAYYDAGITSFMIRGFNMLPDVIEHGQELIPRLRAAVAQRDAAA